MRKRHRLRGWAGALSLAGCLSFAGILLSREVQTAPSERVSSERIEAAMEKGELERVLALSEKFVERFPRSRELQYVLHWCQYKRKPQTQEEADAMKAAFTRILGRLERLYLANRDPTILRSLVELATEMHGAWFVRDAVDSDRFCQKMLVFADAENNGWREYRALGRYFRQARKSWDDFLEMMEKGEWLALLARDSEGQLAICHDRAWAVLNREPRSPKAAADLMTIVRLDRRFGSSSNRALDQLGLIALDRGQTDLARMYLALAARVRPEAALELCGYAKELALELIKRGYADCAISYLDTAYENEDPESVYPDRTDTLYGLGLAYMARGELETAAKWFADYLQLGLGVRDRLVRTLLARIRAKLENKTPTQPARGHK